MPLCRLVFKPLADRLKQAPPMQHRQYGDAILTDCEVTR